MEVVVVKSTSIKAFGLDAIDNKTSGVKKIKRESDIASDCCNFLFISNVSRTSVLSVGPCFGLLVTSHLGFKARVDSLACMFHRLHAADSSDSLLMQMILHRPLRQRKS